MKVMGEKGLGKILSIFLQVCFYAGIIFLITIPFILEGMGYNLGASAFVIYPNGIVLLIITHKFIKLFNSLSKNNPSCDDNIKILKTTSLVTLIGSIFWLIDFIYEIVLAKSNDIVINIVLIFLCVLFFGVSIALYILSKLFQEATEYKKENELTI